MSRNTPYWIHSDFDVSKIVHFNWQNPLLQHILCAETALGTLWLLILSYWYCNFYKIVTAAWLLCHYICRLLFVVISYNFMLWVIGLVGDQVSLCKCLVYCIANYLLNHFVLSCPDITNMLILFFFDILIAEWKSCCPWSCQGCWKICVGWASTSFTGDFTGKASRAECYSATKCKGKYIIYIW